MSDGPIWATRSRRRAGPTPGPPSARRAMLVGPADATAEHDADRVAEQVLARLHDDRGHEGDHGEGAPATRIRRAPAGEHRADSVVRRVTVTDIETDEPLPVIDTDDPQALFDHLPPAVRAACAALPRTLLDQLAGLPIEALRALWRLDERDQLAVLALPTGVLSAALALLATLHGRRALPAPGRELALAVAWKPDAAPELPDAFARDLFEHMMHGTDRWDDLFGADLSWLDDLGPIDLGPIGPGMAPGGLLALPGPEPSLGSPDRVPGPSDDQLPGDDLVAIVLPALRGRNERLAMVAAFVRATGLTDAAAITAVAGIIAATGSYDNALRYLAARAGTLRPPRPAVLAAPVAGGEDDDVPSLKPSIGPSLLETIVGRPLFFQLRTAHGTDANFDKIRLGYLAAALDRWQLAPDRITQFIDDHLDDITGDGLAGVVDVLNRRMVKFDRLDAVMGTHGRLLSDAAAPTLADLVLSTAQPSWNFAELCSMLAAPATAGVPVPLLVDLLRGPLAGLTGEGFLYALAQNASRGVAPGGIIAHVGNAGADVTINQRLSAPGVNKNCLAWVQRAIGLRGWAAVDVNNFLGVGAVKNACKADKQTENACWWLLQFAIHHRPPSALADNLLIESVAVNHVGGPRQVNLNGWIVNHLLNRHSFCNFDFTDPAVMARPKSTMFGAETRPQILARLKSMLATNDCRQASWAGAAQFQIGSYAVRLDVDPGGGYRFTQVYLDKALAAGIEIPKAVLDAMALLF